MRSPRRVAALVASAALLPALAVAAVTAGTASSASAATAIATNGMSPAPFGTDGRLDVFTRLSSGALGHQVLRADGVWTSTESLGGVITSQPTAVSTGLNKLAVVARDTRGAPTVKTYDSGWRGWTSLGGGTNAAPAASSWGGGRLDVWVRGDDNGLYHRWYDSGRWSGWERLYGRLGSGPAAASWGSGRLDVVARGADGALWWRYWDVSTKRWTAWTSLGGGIVGEPTIAASGPGSLDVFARGTTGHLYTRTLRPGTSGWSGWQNLGGGITSSPGATSTGTDSVAVFAKGTDNRYYWRARTGTTWSGWRVVDVAATFHHLGMWDSVYEYATTKTSSPLNPQTATADMSAHGVRTLYLQTGRFTSAGAFEDEPRMAQWLEAAHARGMRVVGWYVPDYFTNSSPDDRTDINGDIARTVAIASYVSPAGQRFDALGIDIEYPWSISGRPASTWAPQWNNLVTQQLAGVRARTRLPAAAIVVPPALMDLNNQHNDNRWAGFPWASIGRYTDAVVPMVYWTDIRSYCQSDSQYCAYGYAKGTAQRIHALTGLPVSEIGGNGTDATIAELRDFVRGAHDGGAIGGSMWTYAMIAKRSDASTVWSALQPLNAL